MRGAAHVAEPHRSTRPRGTGIRPHRDRAGHAHEQLRGQPGQGRGVPRAVDQDPRYFTAQPGFISLRLHRAVSADAPFRWVNVANWESEAHFRAAHGTDEFRRLVTQPGWEEFPSSPMLYQVVTEVG